MANTTTNTGLEPDRTKELEAEIAALRQDLAAITDTLSGMARDTGRQAKREIKRAQLQAADAAEDIKERVVDEYEHYEDELQGAIRERPITSVLIAAGVGFILSKVL